LSPRGFFTHTRSSSLCFNSVEDWRLPERAGLLTPAFATSD
jgi:hypothetical protein